MYIYVFHSNCIHFISVYISKAILTVHRGVLVYAVFIVFNKMY